MNKFLIKFRGFQFFVLFMLTQMVFSQSFEKAENQVANQNVLDTGVEMLRKDAKFYVVVASLLIIFLLIATYLFLMDKKISKLEKLKEQK
ncbi:MAG: CcmD family protein [Cytophagales bacterium]